MPQVSKFKKVENGRSASRGGLFEPRPSLTLGSLTLEKSALGLGTRLGPRLPRAISGNPSPLGNLLSQQRLIVPACLFWSVALNFIINPVIVKSSSSPRCRIVGLREYQLPASSPKFHSFVALFILYIGRNSALKFIPFASKP